MAAAAERRAQLRLLLLGRAARYRVAPSTLAHHLGTQPPTMPPLEPVAAVARVGMRCSKTGEGFLVSGVGGHDSL